jgi:hypothetical protein
MNETGKTLPITAACTPLSELCRGGGMNESAKIKKTVE